MGFEDMMEGFGIGGTEAQFGQGAIWIPPDEPTPSVGGGVLARELVAP